MQKQKTMSNHVVVSEHDGISIDEETKKTPQCS